MRKIIPFSNYDIVKEKTRLINNFILEKVKTVFDKKKQEKTFYTKDNLLEDEIRISAFPSGVERSYEDRSVHVTVDKNGNSMDFFLNGEEAIELGQLFISQGAMALEDNMINHQKIHHYSQLDKFLREDRIEKVILTFKKKDTKNFGDGFYLFNIKPVWKEGKAPEYQEDFNFDDVIHFSPFEEEYKEHLKRFGGEDKVEFVDYDHQKEMDKFQEEILKQK